MGLLELVKHEKEMRRLFGERELKIIEKQLLGVNLSASEKTRLSRDIRSKFKVIFALSGFGKEFGLKKGQEIKFLINEAKEIIFESKLNLKVKRIILFGSATENKLRLESDIDLSVEFEDITKKEAMLFRVEISGKVSDKVEVQVFNILPKKLQNEITKKGKVIYENGKN